MRRILASLILGSASLATPCLGSNIELNVIPSDRASFGAAQKWASSLASLRSVRVRSDTSKPARPEAKWVGSTLYITGVIGLNDRLAVPGRKFSVRETKALAAWIESQKAARDSGSTDPKDQKFGLSVKEIQKVHELLKVEVSTSTKDVLAIQALRDILRSNALPLRVDRQVLQKLSQTRVKTEWKGFSSGTVLAALLRPDELVFVPKVTGGRIQLLVRSESAAKEGWPVGWPPEAKKQQLVPKLFDTLPIEIYDTPITEIMAAIEGRIETPIVFDEGLFAAAKVDPATVKISLNYKKSFYGKVIRKALFDAKMKSEIRVDERGKPFYWVMPIVPPTR